MVTLPRLALAAALFAAACGSPPVDPEAPLARIDLRAAAGQADVTPVGVAVDGAGNRFVFDEQAGLYRVDGATLTLVMPMANLPVPEIAFQPPFTDVVALGPDRFAITAIGDGFLLDVAARTMQQFFCYLPDDAPLNTTQRADAIAFDERAGLLFAQPRAFDSAGNLLGSSIAEYSSTTGIDLAWHTIPEHIAAGGMVKIPDGALLIGSGRGLYRFDDEQFTPADDLERFGVTRVDGLAIDGDRLLIVDGVADELIEIDLAAYR